MIQEFKEWLDNTTLLPRSRSQYLKVIGLFLRSSDDISIENVNGFLQEREGHYYRFAFKYFFDFLERPNDYSLLKKIRRKPRRRHGVYTEKERLVDLIQQIKRKTYRIVALIQYYTGARPHDVLGLRKEDIKIKKDGLVLYLIVKGNREHTANIPFPEAQEILDFIQGTEKEYPFLRGKSKSLTNWIDNNYRYYYQEIREASELIGLKGFRPHDFRRNMASDVYRGTKDLFLTKEILGHKRIETTVRYIERIKKEDETKKAIERFRR